MRICTVHNKNDMQLCSDISSAAHYTLPSELNQRIRTQLYRTLVSSLHFVHEHLWLQASTLYFRDCLSLWNRWFDSNKWLYVLNTRAWMCDRVFEFLCLRQLDNKTHWLSSDRQLIVSEEKSHTTEAQCALARLAVRTYPFFLTLRSCSVKRCTRDSMCTDLRFSQVCLLAFCCIELSIFVHWIKKIISKYYYGNENFSRCGVSARA